ncbi:MAG: hypothetical protein KTR31_12700 [Myxococcales bacterium]|nr:hypothetical protein [Myxococcales bacterium]
MTAIVVTLLAGCGGSTGSEPTADVDPLGQAPLPTDQLRGWRRMDIQQLDASIRRVTGGIGWDDSRGNSEFVALSATLGVPDYLDVTTEDLQPTLLFQKFLDDAAHEVCDELVDREATGGAGNVLLVGLTADDTFAEHRAEIEGALSSALLRFHGRSVATTDPQLEPWTFLFESTELVTESPRSAWRTVCVGLLTHPDFYTY